VLEYLKDFNYVRGLKMPEEKLNYLKMDS